MIRALIVAALLIQSTGTGSTLHTEQTPPTAAPTFSEVESLTVANFNLRRALIESTLRELQREQDNWARELAAFKAKVEAARPGWTWNPEDGKWTRVESRKEK